jgi:hypothetical protein
MGTKNRKYFVQFFTVDVRSMHEVTDPHHKLLTLFEQYFSLFHPSRAMSRPIPPPNWLLTSSQSSTTIFSTLTFAPRPFESLFLARIAKLQNQTRRKAIQVSGMRFSATPECGLPCATRRKAIQVSGMRFALPPNVNFTAQHGERPFKCRECGSALPATVGRPAQHREKPFKSRKCGSAQPSVASDSRLKD